jgi:hypothetical protein
LEAGQKHTFEVRAVDTQGNKDPTPDTFTWTVLTPKQAIQKLVDTIDSIHLSKGTTASLEAPLNAAIRQLNRNNDVAACNTLNAFLDQVSQKEIDGQLTAKQAADLRQQATAIQDELGCSSSSSSSSAASLPSPSSPTQSQQRQQQLSPDSNLSTDHKFKSTKHVVSIALISTSNDQIEAKLDSLGLKFHNH